MVCFEVHINGVTVCTAGVGDLGVLSAILTWVKRDPARCPEGTDQDEWCHEKLFFDLGGRIGHDDLRWIKKRTVGSGIRGLLERLGIFPG